MSINRHETTCRLCSVVLPQLLSSGKLSCGSPLMNSHTVASGSCVRITTRKPSPSCIRKRGMSAHSKNARYTLLMIRRFSTVGQRCRIETHLQVWSLCRVGRILFARICPQGALTEQRKNSRPGSYRTLVTRPRAGRVYRLSYISSDWHDVLVAWFKPVGSPKSNHAAVRSHFLRNFRCHLRVRAGIMA